jgi:hypothetical protein
VARARSARTDRPIQERIRGPEAKVLRELVSRVSELPFVEQVFAVPGYEGLEIWTVIDAEPYADAPSDQVYEAELRSALASPDAYVSFQLVNRLEYGEEKLAQVLPEHRHVAWRRADLS